MGVKGPTSPLSSGAEQLESLSPKDVRDLIKTEKFEKALNELEGKPEESGKAEQPKSQSFSAMQKIASNYDLGNSESALSAVKQSAQFMIGSRLKKDFRESNEGRKMIDDLSDSVSNDPSLSRRILGILQKMKSKKQVI
jgi:hypothetical protein